MNLPEPIRAACAPLFDRLPLDSAMPHLVGDHSSLTDVVETVLRDPALADKSELASALWLYVDNLDRSHTISQGIDDETGSFWHGIMHRREGDFGNSRYWMRRAERHPMIRSGALDPVALVGAVESAHGENRPDLVDRQRAEWLTLFEWCASHGESS